MLNDVHMMVLAIVASQAGIAVLLFGMALLEPTAAGSTHRAGQPRQVPVPREAGRRSPGGRHR